MIELPTELIALGLACIGGLVAFMFHGVKNEIRDFRTEQTEQGKAIARLEGRERVE